MNTEIFELSEEEITTVSGGIDIDPPNPLTDRYPQIENDPPG